MPDPITSPANPRIKALVRLRSRKERDATRRFLVEGDLELRRANEGGVAFEELYATEEGAASELARTIASSGAVLYECSEEALDKATVRGGGLLAVASRRQTGLDQFEPGPTPLLLVAASIEKPGNLGAMLRTAASAGVDGVIATDPVVDISSPNVIRASVGAVFLIPVAVASTEETQRWLRSREIPWLGSSATGATPLWDADLTGAVALVVGSEATGLEPEWRSESDLVIPTGGPVASLNTSVSAAVLLFEASRQRRAAALPAVDQP